MVIKSLFQIENHSNLVTTASKGNKEFASFYLNNNKSRFFFINLYVMQNIEVKGG